MHGTDVVLIGQGRYMQLLLGTSTKQGGRRLGVVRGGTDYLPIFLSLSLSPSLHLSPSLPPPLSLSRNHMSVLGSTSFRPGSTPSSRSASAIHLLAGLRNTSSMSQT